MYVFSKQCSTVVKKQQQQKKTKTEMRFKKKVVVLPRLHYKILNTTLKKSHEQANVSTLLVPEVYFHLR